MADKTQYSVVLFYSTSSALYAERLFKKMGMSVKPIPVPRHLSSDCGICIRFERSDEAKIKQILDEKLIETQGIHPV